MHVALLKIPESFRSFNIGGLQTLDRTLIALHKTGVHQISVFCRNPEDWTAHREKRVAALPVRFFHESQMENALTLLFNQEVQNGCFLIKEPLVVDISVLQDLTCQTDSQCARPDTTDAILYVYSRNASESIKRWAWDWWRERKTLPPASVVVVGQRLCHTVHNEADARQLKNLMVRNLIKPTDGIVSRYLNRPISTSISRRLVYLPLLPNQITLFTGAIAFLPCWFMYEGGNRNWLIGTAIYQLASILDGVDGEIARMKMLQSRLGQWLDTLLDFVSMIAALACLVIGVHRVAQPEWVRWAGKLSVLFAILCFLGLLLFLWRFKKEGTFNIDYSFLKSESNVARVFRSLSFMGKRDFYIFFFFLLALAGKLPWALVYVAGFALLMFVFITLAHLKK